MQKPFSQVKMTAMDVPDRNSQALPQKMKMKQNKIVEGSGKFTSELRNTSQYQRKRYLTRHAVNNVREQSDFFRRTCFSGILPQSLQSNATSASKSIAETAPAPGRPAERSRGLRGLRAHRAAQRRSARAESAALVRSRAENQARHNHSF